MADYLLEFTNSARRQLNSLPRSIQVRIDKTLLSLVTNPRPAGVKKMKGFANR